MSEAQRCIRCGAPSPETTGESTLISMMGWRVRRSIHPDGTISITFYCPPCWLVFKRDSTQTPKSR